MIPIAPEEWTGAGGGKAEPADSLGRGVQIALTIYLLPVVAIVCAIGVASLLVQKTARLVTGSRRTVGPGHFSSARPGRPGPRPIMARERRRSRVSH